MMNNADCIKCIHGAVCSTREHWCDDAFSADGCNDFIDESAFNELETENDILKRLINGEWVDCDDVQKALGIDFRTGLKMFDFSRTAEWNPYPLNGQKITIKFRLKMTGDPQ